VFWTVYVFICAGENKILYLSVCTTSYCRRLTFETVSQHVLK
jgi:hypothetical protein